MNFSGTNLRTAHPGGIEASSGWCPGDACLIYPGLNRYETQGVAADYPTAVAPLIAQTYPTWHIYPSTQPPQTQTKVGQG